MVFCHSVAYLYNYSSYLTLFGKYCKIIFLLINVLTNHFSRSSQVYYMFGFLFLVFLILVITCSETTILLCYFHLCAEVNMLYRSYLHIFFIKYCDINFFTGLSLVVAQLSYIRLYCCLLVNLLYTFLRH